MTQQIDLQKYQDFVAAVTSDASNDLETMIVRLRELNNTVNIALLMTGAIGMSAEGGEFAEVVKKCVFQGKPMNEETIFHMKRELGDIAWYFVNAARAIGENPNEVIAENVRKLEARYPGGAFDPYYSENRKDGDL
jgi:NTP pyrophosphatase (non-canonical NTP hydrolase)|tara:strand:+ start:651 stop:1058 length:408 start_codon:yes stop_codon:yes gene_type:complete